MGRAGNVRGGTLSAACDALGRSDVREAVMEWLIPIWFGSIVWYFAKTTETQRQGHLLTLWGFMLIPVIYYVVIAL